MKDPHHLIVDGTQLIYRGLFRRHHSTHSLKHTVASYVLGRIRNVVQLVNATHISVVFDLPGDETCWRRQLYPEYKQQRKDSFLRDDARTVLPYVEEVCRICGLATWSWNYFEADDVIGTLTRSANASMALVTIFSRDKDFLQLLRPGVATIHRQGNIWFSMTEEKVLEYKGVKPSQMALYHALVGDSADNIKGAKGVGPKLATSLLAGGARCPFELLSLTMKERGKISDWPALVRDYTLTCLADIPRIGAEWHYSHDAPSLVGKEFEALIQLPAFWWMRDVYQNRTRRGLPTTALDLWAYRSEVA